MKNQVVYTSKNNGEYTKELIMLEINHWLLSTNTFDSPTNELKDKIYNMLLDRLEWQSPYTLLLELDEEDINELNN